MMPPTPRTMLTGLVLLASGLGATRVAHLDAYWALFPLLAWATAHGNLTASIWIISASVVSAFAFQLEQAATRLDWLRFAASTVLYGASGAALLWAQARYRDRTHAQADAIEQMQRIIDTKPQAVCLMSVDGTIAYANPAFAAELDLPPSKLVGAKLVSFLHPDDVPTFKQAMLALESGSGPCSLSFRIVQDNGRSVHLYREMKPCFDRHRKLVNVQMLAHEDPESQAEISKLREISRQQDQMLNTLHVGVLKTHHQEIIWQNKAATELLGYSPQETFLQPGRMLYFDDESFAEVRRLALAANARDQEFTSQVRLRKKTGDPVWLEVRCFRISKESHQYLWMMMDITEKKQYQDQIEHIAFYDALTGLPNRLLLADRLNQGFVTVKRQGKALALGYIDLDGFKEVNDTQGHHAGDVVLIEVALRIKAALRGGDTVSRLGGDEFALVLSSVENEDECLTVLARIQQAVSQPIDIGTGTSVSITMSVGLSTYPKHATSARTLLEMADKAMYRSKHSGGNRVTVYSPQLESETHHEA